MDRLIEDIDEKIKELEKEESEQKAAEQEETEQEAAEQEETEQPPVDKDVPKEQDEQKGLEDYLRKIAKEVRRREVTQLYSQLK